MRTGSVRALEPGPAGARGERHPPGVTKRDVTAKKCEAGPWSRRLVVGRGLDYLSTLKRRALGSPIQGEMNRHHRTDNAARAVISLVGALTLATGCLRKQAGAGAQSAEASAQPAAAPAPAGELLQPEPTDVPSGVFWLDGKPFCFAGSNNYYLTYKPREMVDDVFVQAQAMGLKVMRTWAYEDRGSLDGSVESVDGDGTKEGVFFQAFDPKAGEVVINDGENGLQRLDYVLAKAAEHDIKVVMVLTNNWKEFGGMNQYLKWFGLQYHHEFYTDERAKAAYKAYAAHLINRVNTVNDRPYKEDPTIFSWELANEPRCRNYGPYDRLEECNADTITSWVGEMSAYVKSLDANHMVSVGDEGFFNRKGEAHEMYKGTDGVDHEAFLAMSSIDFGTFHLYPDNWGVGTKWGNQWIVDHIEAAQKVGKPTVLEEYGIVVKRNHESNEIERGLERRKLAYENWNNLMLKRGGAASMFWILVGIDPFNESTGLYRDYDGFSVYNVGGEQTTQILTGFASQYASSARACELAASAGVAAEPSPFVSATKAEGVAFRARRRAPLAINWLR